MRAALEAVIVFHPCIPPRPRPRARRVVQLPEATVPTRAEVSYEVFHGEPAPNFDAFADAVPDEALLRGQT